MGKIVVSFFTRFKASRSLCFERENHAVSITGEKKKNSYDTRSQPIFAANLNPNAIDLAFSNPMMATICDIPGLFCYFAFLDRRRTRLSHDRRGILQCDICRIISHQDRRPVSFFLSRDPETTASASLLGTQTPKKLEVRARQCKRFINRCHKLDIGAPAQICKCHILRHALPATRSIPNQTD